jgi:hypothetical protein
VPRHHRLGSPGLPSVAQWEAENRASARNDRDRALVRLVCQTRGCREGLAMLCLHPEAGLALSVRAVWRNEPTDDPRVVHRIRLRGATDTISDPVYLIPGGWRKGSRLEFVCRRGHESSFGAGHLAQRLRAVVS